MENQVPPPPPGQGPIDPRSAFSPPVPPHAAVQMGRGGPLPPPPMGGGWMPPPPMMMPPMMPPPYMQPPRPPKSFTRMVFMTLATVIFGLSITLNLYLLLATGLLDRGAQSSVL